MAHSYHSALPSTRYHPVVGLPAAHARTQFVAIDEHHVALPKLYGAPAYARPAPVVEETARPFDPDDLPIEAVMTDEEREIALSLPPEAFLPGGARLKADKHGRTDGPNLNPKPLSLRALAGKVLGKGN
jgi:hypothetical protein